MTAPRTYRFSDSQRPGLLLGLSGRQAVPVAVGVLALAVVLQTGLHPLVGVIGPLFGMTIAFGKWRGAPLTDTLIPGSRLNMRKAFRRRRWVRPPLVGDNTNHALPAPLRGLELIEQNEGHGRGIAFVRDRQAGTLTVAVRVHGHGFPTRVGRRAGHDAHLVGGRAVAVRQ